ncbi:Dabb family protein [Azospirillum griseum]|uniref:Dabb family protein n=1 Tax=Azospirillum griseum TaxID=2496639 RepID=A0A3S0HZS0_9PROT|nr:Dabb family protein [Azospirillum griseum]RTR18843.1 Dabb family protein [Azospirillum griseum]
MAKINHIVLFGWTESATDEQRAACVQALHALPGLIPGLLSCTGGPQISPEPHGQGFDYGVVMTFADLAARDLYLTHPVHLRVIRDHIAPILARVQVLDHAL